MENGIFKVLKEKIWQARILYPRKISFKNLIEEKKKLSQTETKVSHCYQTYSTINITGSSS